MKVLLVEDDPSKEDRLTQAILEVHPSASLQIARSVQQAVVNVDKGPFDLIVLDIALPSHQSQVGGAQPLQQPSGGVEVLLELSFGQRSDRVVIVTQYPDIEFGGKFYPLSKFPRMASNDLSINLKAVVKYHPSGESWKTTFKREIA